MAKTSIEIENERLARMQSYLRTATPEDTVEAAFSHIEAEVLEARQSFIERAKSGYFEMLLDPEVERKMWS